MDIHVTDVPDESRYEARDGDGTLLGISVYDVVDGTVAFTHTEVDEAVEGKGVASTLVRAALDDVRGSGRRVAALCPYVKSWIERHPDYQDLLTTHP
ncbi:N-acetyltransferase [Cellulomonas sp. JH27-2]|uniref:GNAT family N-acetyltransferase n=1 Tax=Cellulomonas sp. JH27-2 TaxID=2774139 RepID=UPI001780335E|nr:GNAT family N-acetyltransferase [Cellulomonas sp. JH27-2]MBD8059233.1 N-acetyltransferase [Cellulomonas sp. JH27-2]